MIKILLDVVIIAAIILLAEKQNKNATLDFGGVASLVIVPALLVFLVSLVIMFLGLPIVYTYVGYLLYFIVPFAMLKKSFNYSLQRSIAYASIFLGTVLLTEAVLYFLAVQVSRS